MMIRRWTVIRLPRLWRNSANRSRGFDATSTVPNEKSCDIACSDERVVALNFRPSTEGNKSRIAPSRWSVMRTLAQFTAAVGRLAVILLRRRQKPQKPQMNADGRRLKFSEQSSLDKTCFFYLSS